MPSPTFSRRDSVAPERPRITHLLPAQRFLYKALGHLWDGGETLLRAYSECYPPFSKRSNKICLKFFEPFHEFSLALAHFTTRPCRYQLRIATITLRNCIKSARGIEDQRRIAIHGYRLRDAMYEALSEGNEKLLTTEQLVAEISTLPEAPVALMILAANGNRTSYTRAAWVARQLKVPFPLIFLRRKLCNTWSFHYRVVQDVTNVLNQSTNSNSSPRTHI